MLHTTDIKRTAFRIANIRDAVQLYSDIELLGPILQPMDVGRDFVSGHNNYVWWWAIGRVECPRTIAEIGVRFGYSLWTLTGGVVGHHPPEAVELWCYDAEADYGQKTNDVFLATFAKYGFTNIHMHAVDTQKLATLAIPTPVDLVSVDGNHSESGVYHDCRLAYGALRPGGLMVVDDTQPGDVRDGCERFCEDFKLPFAYLNSYRGIHIIRKPEN